ILGSFPGASPQAFVFRPFQHLQPGGPGVFHKRRNGVAPCEGVRSPTDEGVFRPRPRFLNVGMASISWTGAKLGPGTRLYEMIETLHGPTTRTIGNRSTTRRYSVTRGFVAPKWAKDFSLGRSPRNPRKSHQALKAFQTKLRSATERGKKLAFLRPYRAGRILDSFPGASPQAFVFRPFQGVRSPTRR